VARPCARWRWRRAGSSSSRCWRACIACSRCTESQLLRTAGLGGLWRGAPVRTLEVAAGGVIFFSVLEGVHRLLPMH
jgi:hypothetical protein